MLDELEGQVSKESDVLSKLRVSCEDDTKQLFEKNSQLEDLRQKLT